MKYDKKKLLLYAVTDRKWTEKETLYQQIEKALKGGVTCIQLREKNLDYNNFLAEAVNIKSLCRKYDVPLIINDNVEIAVKSGADGVHIGQKDMEVSQARKMLGDNMILGVSARTVEQALLAEKSGADYLGSGAVFGTTTKSDANNLPLETFSEICNSVSIPVVAIGGISKKNILKLSGLGASGVAVVSAVFSADDIESECKELRTLSEQITAK